MEEAKTNGSFCDSLSVPPRSDAVPSGVGDDEIGGDDTGWLVGGSDVGDNEVGAGETGASVGATVMGALLGFEVGALVVGAMEGAGVVGFAVGELVWIAPTRSA